jgi:hypothetical protein
VLVSQNLIRIPGGRTASVDEVGLESELEVEFGAELDMLVDLWVGEPPFGDGVSGITMGVVGCLGEEGMVLGLSWRPDWIGEDSWP